MQFGGETSLGSAWSAWEEVKTARGLLAGTASGAGTAERALAAYKKYYPLISKGDSQVVNRVR